MRSANKHEQQKDGLKKFNSDDPEISIIIPAWNEENNLIKVLYCFACMEINQNTELIVINNNSTDSTQKILDYFGVKSIFETKQGIANARQAGLEISKGKYVLCADSDTFYPPRWVTGMVSNLTESNVSCVYGDYSLIPSNSNFRFKFLFYEIAKDISHSLKKLHRDYLNVMGFNFGFKKEFALESEGFKMEIPRSRQNIRGSKEYQNASEDGMIALRLKAYGQIKNVKTKQTRVWTSSRRIYLEGGIKKSFFEKTRIHFLRIREYLSGGK